MASIRMNDLSKSFEKNVDVIKDLNLDISDGEFVVLVGPSGCGKSTTLRMIAGLEEVSDGVIYIGEDEVTHAAPKDRDIAMVFQNYALYPHMKVRDNMAFGLKLRKMTKNEIDSRVNTAAEILDIHPLLDRKPRQLSGGQRQRVALGRAIVRQPKAFLFDEPLSNLDAKLRVLMRAEIKKLHQRLKTTMVYVTHDQVEAMTMGDRIVVMKDGIIHQVDTPLNLYTDPADKFVAGFIGSPGMNFLEMEVVEDNEIKLTLNNIILPVPQKAVEKLKIRTGKGIILGIRPEDISVEKTDNRPNCEAVIELIEPMGNEIYLNLSVEGVNIVVRTQSLVTSRMQEKIEIFFNMEKVHFFDPDTEKKIV